uniref:Uncharacterized protein n=1 Tax=Myotis myotis TaxID=51298 RepID=A0A7J7VI32_MYOMY|nr:hypothetical protein mMyoMyo1_008249 [Myotis myotis]
MCNPNKTRGPPPLILPYNENFKNLTSKALKATRVSCLRCPEAVGRGLYNTKQDFLKSLLLNLLLQPHPSQQQCFSSLFLFLPQSSSAPGPWLSLMSRGAAAPLSSPPPASGTVLPRQPIS